VTFGIRVQVSAMQEATLLQYIYLPMGIVELGSASALLSKYVEYSSQTPDVSLTLRTKII